MCGRKIARVVFLVRKATVGVTSDCLLFPRGSARGTKGAENESNSAAVPHTSSSGINNYRDIVRSTTLSNERANGHYF